MHCRPSVVAMAQLTCARRKRADGQVESSLRGSLLVLGGLSFAQSAVFGVVVVDALWTNKAAERW